MGVTFYTGRRPLLRPRLLEKLSQALSQNDSGAVIVMVPDANTLETEMLTLQGLDLEGSFRLSVLSPRRVCQLIFDEAGRPESVSIDERGRAIVMGRVLRELNRKLKWYSGAKDKRGFEMRIVSEITRLKQAGVSPDELRELSDRTEDSAFKWKMRDISLLYEKYEEALSDQFQDGEDEIHEAIRRLPGSKTIRGCRLFVFGFDLTTPVWNMFLAGLSKTALETHVFLPLENDGNARDFTLFQPLQASYERVLQALREENVPFAREYLKGGKDGDSACAHFAREVFSSPCVPFEGKNTSLQVARLLDPLDEARFAASLVRRLVQKNGWRYSDILIVCPDVASYMDSLEYAFDAYEVPLFASESRSTDRHPLPRFLMESLLFASGADGDLASLIATGYCDISDEEADALLSYSARYALTGRALLKPVRRGDPETVETIEGIRKRVAEPIQRLDQALSRADSLGEQLAAVFLYLSELNCARKGELAREALITLNQRTLAQEDAQVWNRVMGVFDQMHELMGEKKLGKALFADLVARAFQANEIKPLPQSADAVNAVSAARVGAMGVKAMIVMGEVSANSGSDENLFAGQEAQAISEAFHVFLGPDSLSKTRSERMYLKNALSLATDYICITYPMSAQDGSSVSPGSLIAEAKKIFPALVERGGVKDDEAIAFMRFSAKKAAEDCAACELSEGGLSESGRAALASIGKSASGGLERLKKALGFRTESENISKPLARQVYGPLSKVSVTRLEAYAGCPFAHFVKYALRPEKEEVFGLNARDEGGFFHEAVRRFLMENKDGIGNMKGEEAARLMNRISDDLLTGALKDAMDDTGVERAAAKKLRRTASRAARMLTEQLSTGAFRPIELEMEFGDSGVQLHLNTDGGTRLGGRIDRVDLMEEGEEKYLRIIDYKRGSKKLDAAEMYYGLQLQLILYLASAMRKYGARSAGAFYFRVEDPVVATESRDVEKIERERSDMLRMDGILPEDPELIKKLADVPERVFKVRFTAKGLDSRTNTASDLQFELLINRALDRAANFVTGIQNGETGIAPAKGEKTDACRYCDYRGVCMLDKRIPGAKIRRIGKMSFPELYEKLQQDETDD